MELSKLVGDFPAFKEAILSSLASPDISVVACKQFLAQLISVLPSQEQQEQRDIASFSCQQWISLLTLTLEILQPRSISFEEPLSTLRISLANLHESLEQWPEAAKILMGIPMDSGHRIVPSTFKVEVFIKIVRLLLEQDENGQEGDCVTGELYLNRASLLMHEIQDSALHLSFKVCQARILDSRHKYPEAAVKYHELSLLVPNPQEQMHALTKCIVCCVLSNPSSLRSRMLGVLYGDKRVKEGGIDEGVRGILEAVYLERLLGGGVVSEFKGVVDKHHLAKLSDGSTILDRSVLEHNIHSITKLYTSISFSQLASILSTSDSNLSPEKAEQICANMILEKRIHGFIDQSEGMVYFRKSDGSGAVADRDAYLFGILSGVNSLAKTIQEQAKMLI